MEPIVRLENVDVFLGGSPVLRQLDLEIGEGHIVGVAGSNGSGKTTLLRTIATLIRPHAGSGYVFGADLGSDQVDAIRPRIGMIGHTPALIPELTLRENLEHVAILGGIDPTRVDRSLEVVGLSAAGSRRADASSFGMKRRVEVAHLLLSAPSLMLLDEALSGLDRAAAGLVSALSSRTVSKGGCVVMVSHDAATLEQMCDQVLHLDNGQLGVP